LKRKLVVFLILEGVFMSDICLLSFG